MSEKIPSSAEPLPTPERNIKERLIAAAKEVARLGGIDQFGEPEDGGSFLYGFKRGLLAYRILTDQRVGALPLTIFVDKKLENGNGILALHKRYEFDAAGNVQCFMHEDSTNDLIDLNKATQVGIGNQDVESVKRAGRAARLRMDQRKDQDEATQRDLGVTLVADETELADVLVVLEEELSVLRSRHQKREGRHE